MSFRVERVYYVPKELREGILYVSVEFETAAHLCACGCGEKVRTPLLPTEWQLTGTDAEPTLRPSIGNWQKPCRSHYLITGGDVVWAPAWSEEEVLTGRHGEQLRREAYFAERNVPWWKRLWNWARDRFRA
ncbi:DUF6527 family protein [Pacificimonas sp. ICDLI1SI03]